MWRAARTLFILAVLGTAFYLYRDNVRIFALQAYRSVAPCAVPISYSLTYIDPRFDIASSSVLSALEDAEALWERATDKELYIHAEEDGALSIRLEYDTRQATTEQLKDLGVTIEENLDSYEAAKAVYERIYASYESDKRVFDAAYPVFQREGQAYEADVRRWNERGGAPSSVHSELSERKAALEREEARLRALQETINDRADHVNTLARALNELAGTLNINVSRYNNVGNTVRGEFEEAIYESGPGFQSITVYEFDSENRLMRVLAHEFGHALGLEHSDDPAAIMYRLNQSKNPTLTEDDMQAVRALCALE